MIVRSQGRNKRFYQKLSPQGGDVFFSIILFIPHNFTCQRNLRAKYFQNLNGSTRIIITISVLPASNNEASMS